MKIDKQNKVLAIIETKRYKVEGNNVLSFKKGEWRSLSPTLLPSGYKQYVLFNGKRGEQGIRVVVYQHIFTYMFFNGAYAEGLVIDHIDGDVSNNCIDNLRAVTPRQNLNPAKAYETKAKGNFQTNPIRNEAIKAIRELMGQGYSQAHIARILGYNRLSVRYTINNIKARKKLKYEEA